jgi:RNA polymerase sigma factor (sigma-70 family)
VDWTDPAEDERDALLAQQAAAGDREALTELLSRHQGWIFGVALRMTREVATAQDLAQDALLRVVTRIAQFEGRSGFRSWAYRIVLHTMLNSRRARALERATTFAEYGDFLESLGDSEPSPEQAYAVEETQIRCTLGMLLCLEPEQRLALILGGVLGIPSPVAADLLGWSAASFRKRLERARRDLSSFMESRCGLVRPDNPCRCPKKTRGLIERGMVDPERLQFAGPEVQRFHQEAPSRSSAFLAWADDASLQVLRAQRLPQGPDLAQMLASLLADSGFPLPTSAET